MQGPCDLVRGRSVALVGNSSAILQGDAGTQIDSADVVVRMNRGLPSLLPQSEAAIGVRTDLWATAKYWSDATPPVNVRHILWMKLTELGAVHLARLAASKPSMPVVVWPHDFERECRQFVGADPGTGIRLLWWLRTKTAARSVSCYGMDCWEHPSHWSGRRNTPNHVPNLERAAMLRLL